MKVYKHIIEKVRTYYSFNKDSYYYPDTFKQTTEEIKFQLKCLCCEKEMKLLEQQVIDKADDLSSSMLNDGVIDKIAVNYGSHFDGSIFLLTICDECINKKLETGTIIHIKQYM